MNEKIAAIETARMSLDQVRPHPRNPRKHPEPGSKMWEVLKRSLERSYFEPLVWNRRNGFLVSGHLRLKVLRDMGYEQADVSVVDLAEAEHYAVMIAANRQVGEWEEAVLAALAKEIDEAGLDAALALYDAKALLALVDCPVTDDDSEEVGEILSKADQLQQEWQVGEGDLYQIGPHRLLCGRCESPDNWQRLLGDELADMIWCDPPYNVAYDRAQKKRNARKRAEGETPHVKPQTILNDDMPREEYQECLNEWFAMGAARLKAGGAVYIAHAESFGLETRTAARDAGFYIAQCLIWVKQAWTLGRQDYQWQHEPVLYGWKPGAAHHWQGGYSQASVIDEGVDLKKLSKPELVSMVNHLRNAMDTTVIREPRNVVSDLHPTVKPTRLVARQIWNSSRRGDRVMELFGGSGTTMVAAEQTGRRCAATELDPKFCAVILHRMKTLGLQPEKIREAK
jgi:DNA modification methylase